MNDNIIRHQVLSALSQTCRNLRRFFLCYVWQRIEVYRLQSSAQNRTKSRALALELELELVRQLEIVTIRGTPSGTTLAKYVEIVNVEIGVYSRDSVLAEQACCLALFPNLHTVRLKLEHDANISQDTITKPFKGYIYKSVRATVVSSNAQVFLRFCPKSRLVDCYDVSHCRWGHENFWYTVAAYCPQIEVAPYNAIFPVDQLPEIARAFPELCNLTLWPCHFLHWRAPGQVRHLKIPTLTLALE